MLDRSTPNLFHTNPPAAETPTTVIHDKRPRVARPAPGARGHKSPAGLSAPRLSIGTQALRSAASRLSGFRRYLPLSIALSVVLFHDLAGGGHPTAPARSTIAAATVKPTVIPPPRVAPARRHAALPARPAASRPRVTSRPAQVHAAHRVYPQRVVIVPARPAPAAAKPAPTAATPNATPSPAPAVASTAAASSPSEHGAEFGFEN